MVKTTKNDKVVVQKTLTKSNNISKCNKEPSIKLIPGDTNKPIIISDGKEWNIEELKIRLKKSKALGKKNEGKDFKKPNAIIDRHGDKTFGNPIVKTYHDKLFFKVFDERFSESKLIKTNDDNVKWYDIYDTCFTKKELITKYDVFKIKNRKKHKQIFLKN
jgi:hypothetical protein